MNGLVRTKSPSEVPLHCVSVRGHHPSVNIEPAIPVRAQATLAKVLDRQILDSIVIADAVDVEHALALEQGPSEVLLHDEVVLPNPSITHEHRLIAVALLVAGSPADALPD